MLKARVPCLRLRTCCPEITPEHVFARACVCVLPRVPGRQLPWSRIRNGNKLSVVRDRLSSPPVRVEKSKPMLELDGANAAPRWTSRVKPLRAPRSTDRIAGTERRHGSYNSRTRCRIAFSYAISMLVTWQINILASKRQAKDALWKMRIGRIYGTCSACCTENCMDPGDHEDDAAKRETWYSMVMTSRCLRLGPRG